MKVLAATAAVVLALSASSGCKLGGPDKTPSSGCVVSGRDADSVRIKCYNKDNGDVLNVQDVPAPSGAYPNCRVNQPWPACK